MDLPGIIEGAAAGKGRGKQVIAVARTADLILMMLDSRFANIQKRLLEKELEAVGIRLNKTKPDVYFKQRISGGIGFSSSVQLTHMDEKMAVSILHEYRIFNAEVLLREDVTVDEFIDVIVGNRKYIKCIYVSTHEWKIYLQIVCFSVTTKSMSLLWKKWISSHGNSQQINIL